MSLIVFPAIDLKGGNVVRLSEGDMDSATIYGSDPVAQAMAFAEANGLSGNLALPCSKPLRKLNST